MSFLYVVATPIGNLGDLSKRAIEVLNRVDLILCEDTRVTQKLLNYFGIKTKTLSYHQHSKLKKINYILEVLGQGKNLALVSDAGTPGISDPGSKLIEAILRCQRNPRSWISVTSFKGENKGEDEITIVPIPGPSALTAAVSISGFPMDKFLFLGFPPAKRKRKKFFQEAINSKYPVIFYESPHRILKSLNELRILKQELKIVVCRELTKKFEITYRDTVEKVLRQLEKEKIRGEFVVIVSSAKMQRA